MANEVNELDRLIDALNVGHTPIVDAAVAPELAGLLNAVTRIRRLREANEIAANSPDEDWSRRAVRELARELMRPDTAKVVQDPSTAVVDASTGAGEHFGPTPLSTKRTIHGSISRQRIPRELVQMAAAILVLVLVTGLLVVIFRNQGRQRSGAIGSTTSTTAFGLPMTVTAHGIAVTLGLVDSTSSATRFHVNVALPAYAVGQPRGFILGQAPADDVQLVGMNASANDLHVSEADTTLSNVTLWMDYPAPFPTHRTATLTIQQLWLPAEPTGATPAPIHNRVVKGPWVFHITPTAVAAQPPPKPAASDGDCLDSGTISAADMDCYYGVSAPLAQKLTGFPVTEPTSLAAGLVRNAFGATVLRLGPTHADRPNYVSLDYPRKSGQGAVNLVETTDATVVPIIHNGTVSTVTHVASNGAVQTKTTRPSALKFMTIDGVIVTQFEFEGAGPVVANFVWRQAGISYYMSASIPSNAQPSLTVADLTQMVTSVIGQRAGSATSASNSPSSAEIPSMPRD